MVFLRVFSKDKKTVGADKTFNFGGNWARLFSFSD
jgi:hypothetical protein